MRYTMKSMVFNILGNYVVIGSSGNNPVWVGKMAIPIEVWIRFMEWYEDTGEVVFSGDDFREEIKTIPLAGGFWSMLLVRDLAGTCDVAFCYGPKEPKSFLHIMKFPSVMIFSVAAWNEIMAQYNDKVALMLESKVG